MMVASHFSSFSHNKICVALFYHSLFAIRCVSTCLLSLGLLLLWTSCLFVSPPTLLQVKVDDFLCPCVCVHVYVSATSDRVDKWSQVNWPSVVLLFTLSSLCPCCNSNGWLYQASLSSRCKWVTWVCFWAFLSLFSFSTYCTFSSVDILDPPFDLVVLLLLLLLFYSYSCTLTLLEVKDLCSQKMAVEGKRKRKIK